MLRELQWVAPAGARVGKPSLTAVSLDHDAHSATKCARVPS